MTNQIDASAIAEVERLVQASQQPREVAPASLGGLKLTLVRSSEYVDAAGLVAKEPIAAPLVLSQLSSFADFFVSDPKNLEHLIVVDGPTRVRMVGPLQGHHRQRESLAVAELKRDAFAFGQFMPLEEFVIRVQTGFVDTGHRAAVLALVGNVKEEAVRTSTDDGVTQTVATRVGITRAEQTDVPPIVNLAPYRTFAEVDQPVSPFLLRMQGGSQGEKPRAALFEADGGAWRVIAVERIASRLHTYLAEALPLADRPRVTILS